MQNVKMLAFFLAFQMFITFLVLTTYIPGLWVTS